MTGEAKNTEVGVAAVEQAVDQLDEVSIILLMFVILLGVGAFFGLTFLNLIIVLSAIKMVVDGFRNDKWGIRFSTAAILLSAIYLMLSEAGLY